MIVFKYTFEPLPENWPELICEDEDDSPDEFFLYTPPLMYPVFTPLRNRIPRYPIAVHDHYAKNYEQIDWTK